MVFNRYRRAAIELRRPGHGQPRMMADSSVRRLRMIQAAERARHAIAHGAIGWAVISGVTRASSASQATSEMTNSTVVPQKPARSFAGSPEEPAIAASCLAPRA